MCTSFAVGKPGRADWVSTCCEKQCRHVRLTQNGLINIASSVVRCTKDGVLLHFPILEIYLDEIRVFSA